jgi:hypothetical protein
LEVIVPIVQQDALEARDLEIYRAWSLGERQHQIAKRMGMDQSNISRAISRARKLQPQRDRAEIFDQSLEMIEDLLAVYQPLALAKDKAAGRLVDRLLGRRDALLGLENVRKLELFAAQDQIRHDPGPTVEEILERWRAEGKLRFTTP